jgi:hypothetical protein
LKGVSDGHEFEKTGIKTTENVNNMTKATEKCTFVLFQRL